MVHRIIAQIGHQEELGEDPRLQPERHGHLLAVDRQLIGTTVDKRSEACDACHVGGAAAG